MIFTYTVEVEVPDADLRFFDGKEPLAEQAQHMLQQGLDDYGSNIADESFDDEGRMSVDFKVMYTS